MSKAINIRNQAAAAPVGPAYEIDLQYFTSGEHFTDFGPDAHEWTGQKDTGVDIDELMSAKEIYIAKGLFINTDGVTSGYFNLLSPSFPTVVAHAESNITGSNHTHSFCAGAGAMRIELTYKKIRTKFYLVRMVLGSEYVKI